MGASEEGALAYSRAGLDALQLGDEAIIDTATSTSTAGPCAACGRRCAGSRRPATAAGSAGTPNVAPSEMAERLGPGRRVAGHRDRARLLDGAGPARRSGRRRVRAGRGASTSEGELRAVLSFVPWGRNGLSLDLMRRDRDSDNGLVEFMVVGSSRTPRRLGVDRISLNFAMFREVFEEGGRIGAGPVMPADPCGAAVLQQVVAARVAVPVEREVPARSGCRGFLCFAEPGTWPGSASRWASPRASSTYRVGALLRRGRREPSHDRPRADRCGRSSMPMVGCRRGDGGTEETRTRSCPSSCGSGGRSWTGCGPRGIDPYPVGFARTATTAQVRGRAPGPAARHPHRQRGRRRRPGGAQPHHGRLCFATLRDGTGRIQVMLEADRIGDEPLHAGEHDIDLGDHVGVTRRGRHQPPRRAVGRRVDGWMLTAKCLRPLPDKHKGLTDPEARVRQRHVDLIVNPAARDMLHARSAAVPGLRDVLDRRGFLEVETPMLQPVHGGANARPFVTHINAYDLKLYLRIAPELFLKRLLVGGVEKVFELNRNFRNEGADATHNPEFTMLEAYEAYGDYNTMRELMQRAGPAGGDPRPTVLRSRAGADADGKITEYDLSGEWRGHHRQRGDLRGAGRDGRHRHAGRGAGASCASGRMSGTTRRGAGARWSWSCTTIWSRHAPCCRRSTRTSRPRCRR